MTNVVKIKGLKTEKYSTDRQEQKAAEAINILCAMLIDAINEGKPFVIAASVLDNNPKNTVVLAAGISPDEARSYMHRIIDSGLEGDRLNLMQP